MDKRRLKHLLVGEFTLKRLVRSTLLVIALVYIGVGIYGYFLTDKIIFQQPHATYKDTKQILKLQTTNGSPISAIYLANPKAAYTILYSHGNAEDLGTDLNALKELRDLGFSVFAYDYNGYGTSAGTPSESNAYADVDATYDYVTGNLRVAPERIIAYGRSLGGAMAVDLASRKPLAGLIIESSFITAFRVVTRVPLFPFDKFRSIDKLKDVHCPVLVIHGKSDGVIPFWHGERLYQQASEPKMFLWIDKAGHNDLLEVAGEKYDTALRKFRDSLKKPNKESHTTSSL